MSFLGPVLGGLLGGLGGLFGGGNQQNTKTSGTITNNQTGSFGTTSGSTVTPNLTPLQKALMGQFTTGATNLFNQSTNLNPYMASGMEQINQGSNAAAQNIAANLASRGLTFSPMGATAQAMNTLSRTGQQAQFANQMPLLQRQMQQQGLQQLMQAFQLMPTGTTTTGSQSGTTSQSGTQTQQGTNLISGNPMGGLFSGLGSGVMAGMAPYLWNQMYQNNQNPNQTQPQAPPGSSNYGDPGYQP